MSRSVQEFREAVDHRMPYFCEFVLEGSVKFPAFRNFLDTTRGGSFALAHSTRPPTTSTGANDCPSTLMCFSSNNLLALLPSAGVNSASSGASPAFAVEAGDGVCYDTPPWLATDDTAAPPVKGARRAWVYPTGFARSPSPITSTFDVVSTSSETPHVDELDVDANAFPSETLETEERDPETPRVEPPTPGFPITPSGVEREAARAITERELNAACGEITPPPAPFAQIAEAARLGRDLFRASGGVSESPKTGCRRNEPRKETPEELGLLDSRPLKLPHATTENILHGTGSALRALVEHIAKPGGPGRRRSA